MAALKAARCWACCCMVVVAKALTTGLAADPPMNGRVRAVL